jgi:hypothetical protein
MSKVHVFESSAMTDGKTVIRGNGFFETLPLTAAGVIGMNKQKTVFG